MSWKLKLKERVRLDEGSSLTAYWDPIGQCWTIGYGHTGPEVTKGLRISQAEAEQLLEGDLAEAVRDARKYFSGFDSLVAARKEVLASMAFNLGLPKLMEFKKLLQALEIGDFNKASLEMLNSRWAAQVKGRAARLAKQMRTGLYV